MDAPSKPLTPVQFGAMRVYLVRHGQTAMNIEGRALGQMDVDLNSEGHRQLPLLEIRFQEIKVNRIFSSDLKRAQETAQAVSRATGATIILNPAIRERSFGEWEGRDYQQVNQKLLDMSNNQGIPLYDVRAPGGESHRDVWERTMPVIEPLFTEQEDVVIVSHGGACRVMLAQLLKATLDTTFSFKFDNTSMTRVDRRDDGRFQLAIYNDTGHMTAPTNEPVSRGTN
jgi:broad specificity phosphatase PhoE